MNPAVPHRRTTTTPRTRPGARTLAALIAVAALALALVACGSSDSGSDGGSDGTGDQTATPTQAEERRAGRIVSLGEERFLADLLALDVRPIASTANVIVEGTFVGLDEFDTEGIEPLPASEANIELLASQEADVIVVNEFVLDTLGQEVFDGMKVDLVVIPDGSAEEQMRALGEAFGREAEAEKLIADLEAKIEEGRTELADVPESERVVSVATIYSGPTLAAWVDGPVDVPATLLALGYTLRPDAEAAAGIPGGPTDGRAYLSEEQIGLFDAPTLVLMQTPYVEGEDAAIEAMESRPLWAQLPAVEAGNVITVDRLGYPGIAGRIRLVDDLVAELGS